jgi:DNA-directed RNA polymerase specialized sigma24 family protein
MHERENPTAIEEAVLSLSRAERCAALLADEICFSETEVAEILGIPTSDVARLRAAASDGLDTDLHLAALNHAHRDAFGNELRS